MSATSLSHLRVAVVATNAFEESELFESVHALRAAGAKVDIIAPEGRALQGYRHLAPGKAIRVDRLLSEASPDDYDALMLPGGTVNADTDGDWNDVVVEGKTVVAAQLAPNHVPPDWPDGAPQQIHLDLHVDDPRAAHDEVLALGARMLQSADFDAPEGFRVYADPAGHPFCLCWS